MSHSFVWSQDRHILYRVDFVVIATVLIAAERMTAAAGGHK